MKRYEIEPKVVEDRYIGSKKKNIVVYVGDSAESTKNKIFLDLSNEFVLMEVGKRGSGKSYSMGALLEGLATKKEQTSISSLKQRRGVLLLDPLDIHWTAIFPVRPDGPPEVKLQYDLVEKWPGLSTEEINVKVWIPAGKNTLHDHPVFQLYYIPVSSLDPGDWSQLLRTDIVMEPRGQLIYEVYLKVTELGWRSRQRVHQPKVCYGIQDLIECLNEDEEISRSYASETIRSVIQPLQSYQRLPLFSIAKGTPLSELIQEDSLSILCLARLEPDLRTVVTSVLVKSMMKERRDASFLERRLSLETLSLEKKEDIEKALSKYISRSILVLDEAQILLPVSGGGHAQKALESYVLEGRNYGLSLWLATQRPSGAISPAAKSQVDIFMIHRLSVKEDIDGILNSLQSDLPTKISVLRNEVSFPNLIRQLETGQAVISSADTQAISNRAFVVNIRPRVTCHGGKAF